jgi:cytochrome d ubiquinol oxidase subunit II
MDYGNLEIFWFTAIAVLWIGYFLLEGFDFGVGMLLRVVGREPVERRVLLHTIGPLWDGNEVWVIVAGGATFAAFPDWYATLFSGFYLPLFLIVCALLLRPVALEFWGKDDRRAWRNLWEWSLVVGSALPAFLWGVAFANIVRGVPIDGEKEFTGSVLDLLNGYALLGGLTSLLLCASHGAVYLTLKTRGQVLRRARRSAAVLAPASALSVLAFVTWTLLHAAATDRATVPVVGAGIAAAALAALVPTLLARGRCGRAFVAHGLAIAGLFGMLFLDLFPNVFVSSTSEAFDLTLGNAASGSYTLTVMTVVAGLLLPLVLVGQAWAYWVFRTRIGPADLGGDEEPADEVAEAAPDASRALPD